MMSMARTTIETATLTLENRPVRFTHSVDPRIGSHLRDHLEISSWQDHELDRLFYQLESFVLAEKVVEKTVERTGHMMVSYPASWWQHFKQDALAKTWLTRWFVNWRPVGLHDEHRYVTLRADFKRYATFPAADAIRTPEHIHKNVVVFSDEITPKWTESRF